MKLISFNEIKSLNITPQQSYEWIDYVLRNRDKFVLPTKVRIPLEGSDYCNVMPSSLPEGKIFGVKMISRNEGRRQHGDLSMDSQIMLYDYDTAYLKAIMDGNYITTVRTAAVAVHSVMNFAEEYKTIAMLGLGNIGIAIGDILFGLIKDKNVTVKLLRYKDQAERFADRFKEYNNVTFEICEGYDNLMRDSDLIISSVTYADSDFCSPDFYKPGCTIIPVHMRGFMECDLAFDHIVVSDMVRAKGFKYYDQYKKVTLTDDILFGNVPIRENPKDRVLIYNLGLAITDLFFAEKIYSMIDVEDSKELRPENSFYM